MLTTSCFNPHWNAKIENEDKYFDEAVKFADLILGNTLAHWQIYCRDKILR